MKKFLIFLFSLCTLAMNAESAREPSGNNITLKVYLPPYINLPQKPLTILDNKLSQIVTVNGLGGDGFEKRFIITAHPLITEKMLSATIPAKVAVKLNTTIYIGDGIDDTTFSSVEVISKGIGSTEEDALTAAIQKIYTKNPAIISCVEEGKNRIINYYNNISLEIIAKAQSLADMGQYDDAISTLSVIPMDCSNYDVASRLMVQYVDMYYEEYNNNLINKAVAVWSSAPDREGANEAVGYLQQIVRPSTNISQKAENLYSAINQKVESLDVRDWNYMIEQENRAWKYQMQQENNRFELAKEAIAASAEIAKAKYSLFPTTIYNIHWWHY